MPIEQSPEEMRKKTKPEVKKNWKEQDNSINEVVIKTARVHTIIVELLVIIGAVKVASCSWFYEQQDDTAASLEEKRLNIFCDKKVFYENVLPWPTIS